MRVTLTAASLSRAILTTALELGATMGKPTAHKLLLAASVSPPLRRVEKNRAATMADVPVSSTRLAWLSALATLHPAHANPQATHVATLSHATLMTALELGATMGKPIARRPLKAVSVSPLANYVVHPSLAT